MTHTYFGLDVYQKLNKNCQNKIESKLEYFKLFCQGPDPFMFYHFLIGKKAENYKKIQQQMHTQKTQLFFLTLINEIKKQNLQNDQEVMSFLYGYICHYYLDKETHPYIYYKSGVFQKENKETYKYNGLHQELEYKIDCYFIQTKEKIPYYRFKIYKEIFNVKAFSKNLKTTIQTSMEKTYNYQNIIKKYQKSIWYMKTFYRYANYDPYGWKLKLYTLIDKITSPTTTKIKELSYHNSYNDKIEFLNLEHKKWNNPWDYNDQFQTSFLDLYQTALTKALQTIEIITKMLETNTIDQTKIKEIFPDLSYKTGLPCHKKVKMKYFEH